MTRQDSKLDEVNQAMREVAMLCSLLLVTHPKPQAVALRPYKSQEPTAVCCPEERLKRREEKLSAEQEE